jgi:hypothetical protein
LATLRETILPDSSPAIASLSLTHSDQLARLPPEWINQPELTRHAKVMLQHNALAWNVFCYAEA